MNKILIIEDNELNMKLFFDILQYQNYDTDKAYDGIEAYEKLKSNAYDLIILDIQLPKLDGFSLLEKLKEEGIEIPTVIIVSACAMDSDKNKAKSYGIDSYITKPIDIKQFVEVVAKELK